MDLMYVFQQGDAVLIGVFCALILMSVVTWYLILYRGVQVWRYRRGQKLFLEQFWKCKNLDEAYKLTENNQLPIAHVARSGIDAWRHYYTNADRTLGASCGLDEFLVRAIRNGMGQAAMRLESGLTIMASVGSTAPFIGLFGTVWGIYHALVGIAAQGNANLETVAGPMGEALVATAAGLAAALPAVLAYNAFNRKNRLISAQLDGFAHDLHAQLLSVPAPKAQESGQVVRLREGS